MIRDNLAQILETIAQTARKVSRNPEDIKLVAVSKMVDVDIIRQAVENGQMLFGENYLQEAAGKIALFPPTVNWHFIGHLQSNKAKQAVELFDVIETVDRWKVAQALDSHSKSRNKKLIYPHPGQYRQGETKIRGTSGSKQKHFFAKLPIKPTFAFLD